MLKSNLVKIFLSAVLLLTGTAITAEPGKRFPERFSGSHGNVPVHFELVEILRPGVALYDYSFNGGYCNKTTVFRLGRTVMIEWDDCSGNHYCYGAGKLRRGRLVGQYTCRGLGSTPFNYTWPRRRF